MSKSIKWTKEKPTSVGFYWRRRAAHGTRNKLEPHVVDVQEHADGELAVHEWHCSEWQYEMDVHFATEYYEYAGPISFPEWN